MKRKEKKYTVKVKWEKKRKGQERENTIRTIKETQANKEKTKLARQQLEEFKDTAVDKKQKDEQIERKIRQIEAREKRKANRQKNKPDQDTV